MNILYTNFHPRNGGGHATYIANLANCLSPQHNITVATPASSRLYQQASKIPGVKCIDTIFSTRVGAMLAEVKKLRALIKAGQFDLVHVNGSADHRQVMLATMFLPQRPKIFWTKHNTAPVKSFGNWLRANLGCSAAIGVSNFVSNILKKSSYRRLPIKTIYHGVDTNRFTNPGAELKHKLRQQLLGTVADDTIVLASVGGTDRDKGWLLLAQAIAALPANLQNRFRLIVAGDLPKGNLLADTQALNLDHVLLFPGLVNNPEHILQAADIGFVLSYHEAFSFAASESLACGLPTLVSDAGGLPEVITTGIDGWVIARQNIAAVNAWLQDILKFGLKPEMAVQARANALDKFAMQVFANNTLSFYQQICASK